MFGKTGLRPQQGMKTYDIIRLIQHILSNIGHSLIKYQLGPWERMQPGSVRYWSGINKRWMRARQTPALAACRAGTSRATALLPGEPTSENDQTEMLEDTVELEDEFADLSSLPLLLLVLDQASTGWAAAHFLASPQPGGMGLHVHFMGDPFHRSWNDFKWACSRATGHLSHAMIQMTICYNANYGPWMKAAFMLKKREALLEYIALHGAAERPLAAVGDTDWEGSSALVAADAREGLPTDMVALQKLFDTTVLTNINFLKKGPYVKMCAWYSILEAIDHYDDVWTSWKHLMQWLSTNLMPKGAADARERAIAEITAAVDDGTSMTAAQHKQQLMQIKRAAGNVLLLTPLLLTSENLFNMRLLLLVGRPLWQEQSLMAAAYTVGQRQRAVSLACGAGVDFCKSLWRHTTADARELARLGVKTTRDSLPYPLSMPSGPLDRIVPESEIPERIWSFLLHVVEARLHSTGWHQHGWPGKFAKILDPASSSNGLADAEEMWEVFCTCEALAAERPGIDRLLQEVHWLQWTVNQVTFRGLAHHRFQPVPAVLDHLERLFGGLGDTKLIEDTHKEIRSQEDQQSNQSITQLRVFHTLTRGTALNARGIHHVKVEQDDWQAAAPSRPLSRQLYHSDSTKLPQDWGCEKVLAPARSRSYTSKSPAGSRASIGAAQALRILFQRHCLDQAGLAWQSCAMYPRTLVGVLPQTPMGIDDTTVSLVLASSTWAAVVWPATALGDGMFVFDTASPWTWITITDVEQWCCLPAAPYVNTCNPTRFGFLGLRQTGTPLPLAVSALLHTKDRLMAWQRKAFCQHFGCTATKTLLEQEIELCTKLMAGHPDLATTLSALETAHGQGPEADNVPEDLEALTAAAFQELDAEEQEQWKDQCEKYKAPNSKAQRLAKQVLSAARKNASIDEEVDNEPLPAPSNVKEDAIPLADPRADAETERAAHLRSLIPFVRPYVPGGPGTKELPSTVTECRANRVERTSTWVARYQSEVPPPTRDTGDMGKQRKDIQQVSKSKVFGVRGTTEHLAFQTTIQWLWDKHQWHHPADVTTLPAHVTQALQICQHCTAKRTGACPIWEALQASQPPAAAIATHPDTAPGPALAGTGSTPKRVGAESKEGTETATPDRLKDSLLGLASARAVASGRKAGSAAPVPPGRRAGTEAATPVGSVERLGLASAKAMASKPKAGFAAPAPPGRRGGTEAATPVRLEESLGLASAKAVTPKAGFATPVPLSSRAGRLAGPLLTLSATEGTLIKVAADGNCLFASMAVGIYLMKGGEVPDAGRTASFAARTRKHMLAWVTNAVKTQELIDGVPVSTWLLDEEERPGITTIDQYTERMSAWGQGRDQWGGFPEVAVLTHMWEAWTVLLQEAADGKSWTLRAYSGSAAKYPKPICIVRTNTEDHWEPVVLQPSAVAKLRAYMAQASKLKPPK